MPLKLSLEHNDRNAFAHAKLGPWVAREPRNLNPDGLVLNGPEHLQQGM